MLIIRSDMMSSWNKTNMVKTDLCVYYHEMCKVFAVMNENELKHQLKEWKSLAQSGKIYMIKENCRSKTINGVEYHILVVQGAGIECMSPVGMLFDEGFFGVRGWIYMFKSKYTRDTAFNWVSKFCQIKYDSEIQECDICMDNETQFKTSCCNKIICVTCLHNKKTNTCPYCRKEY